MIIVQNHVNLTWSTDDAISSATEATSFSVPNKKLSIPVVPLSIEENEKLLQQL